MVLQEVPFLADNQKAYSHQAAYKMYGSKVSAICESGRNLVVTAVFSFLSRSIEQIRLPVKLAVTIAA